MKHRGLVAALAVLMCALDVSAAAAVDYRLLVASMWDEAFTALLGPGALSDGATGHGLDTLASRLDAGAMPRGALLFERHVAAAGVDIASAWGAAPQQALVKLGGGRGDPWDEVRWQGTPGEHSIWIITPRSRQPQQVRHLALGGAGSLRYAQPYTMPLAGSPLQAVAIPLALVRTHERRGTAWRDLGARLDLTQHVAVVVGTTDDFFPDGVWIVVRHAPDAASYRAIIGWRVRDADREAPGWLHLPDASGGVRSATAHPSGARTR
jgi:hypothetical protein